MLTDERKEELLALYDEIKEELYNIEKKYSLSYYKVEMDFPESLGIPKMEYVAPTEAELTEIAEAYVASKFLEKQRNLEKTHANSLANLQKTLNLLDEKHRQKLVAIAADYAAEVYKLLKKLTDNGLYRSSVRTDAEEQAENDRQAAVHEQTLRYEAEKEAVSTQKSALEQTFGESIENLERQRTAAVAAKVQDLKEKEANKKKEADKFNASVDEKESKYKASCERYLQYAQQAENERSLAAAKLYAELGESGVELQKKSQMLNYCKSAMWTLTKEEAQFILSLDSVLVSSLGDYYSSLTDWVNSQLQ